MITLSQRSKPVWLKENQDLFQILQEDNLKMNIFSGAQLSISFYELKEAYVPKWL